MTRIEYITMPYKTGIRLLGVARNPTNDFPARLLVLQRRFIRNSGFVTRIEYITMPYKTGIRLLGVARNPTNDFPARLLVLQRRFIRQGDFRDQFGPEPYCHERTAMAHSCPNTKDQTPYHANRRCNTSWGLKVICGAAESFWASSKFLKCAFHLGIGLGEERISSSFSSPPQ